MRVYLPATWSSLEQLWREGTTGPGPLPACAVTPALREWYVDDDVEELEYAAMTEAARASLRLLAQQPGQPRRRIVLAADVPDAAVHQDLDAGRAHVRVDAETRLSDVVSVHVDEPDAAPAVEAAVAALPQADAGDEDAAFALDEAEAYELLWYATQEIPDLLTP